MIYTIISNRFATLAEIRDVYSVEEVLDLYEICLIGIHNRSKIAQELKDKRHE